jgi:hypothetical protein
VQQETLPQLTPAPPDGAVSCSSFFPQGTWQFVHSIDFQFSGGRKGSALGIVVVEDRAIRCALTTVEGLTLFAAVWHQGGPVQVSRAVAPFDRPGVAEGLLRDVRTIFQSPPGQVLPGELPDSTRVCRYAPAAGEGSTVDILQQKDGCWAMNVYVGDKLSKRIDTSACAADGAYLLPQHIRLTTYGAEGYTLTMQLINAQKIATDL